LALYLIRERPGELPGRGIRCLATERGERGQEEPDKEKSWVCATVSRGVGRVRWREDGSRGSRSARGEKAELSPARCLSNRQPSGRGGYRPIETRQGQNLAWEVSEIHRETGGAIFLGRGASLEKELCPWRSRANQRESHRASWEGGLGWSRGAEARAGGDLLGTTLVCRAWTSSTGCTTGTERKEEGAVC
jgi:hypothetical protein